MRAAISLLTMVLVASLGAGTPAEDAALARLGELKEDRAKLQVQLEQGRERLRREGGLVALEGERAWWDLPTRRRKESRLRTLDLLRTRLEALEGKLKALDLKIKEMEPSAFRDLKQTPDPGPRPEKPLNKPKKTP